MPQFTLYYAPYTCARVTMIALEEARIPFETQLVRFATRQNRSAEYLALNPAGKVPCLIVDGKALTENVAILTWLANSYPQANLLPLSDDEWRNAEILSQLVWCASTLHPLVTRIRVPTFFCDLEGGPERVYAMGTQAMRQQIAPAEQRLADQPWMLSEWSALDAYIFWIWFRITGAGFDDGEFPHLADHHRRMLERPGVKAMLAREAEGQGQLEKEGNAFKPPSLRATSR
jgi:glutathione S-transferase